MPASTAQAEAYRPPVAELEDYRKVPMPPGFGVQRTDVDGPVFVDRNGKTLYTWPLHSLRNGDAGEQKNTPSCDETKYTRSAGLMSPYPPGLTLPDLDTRPTCIELWHPVYATESSKAIGDFSVVVRKDGKKQWAYAGYALYTSVLDKRPGQVNGGSTRARGYDSPVLRVPVGPPSDVPAAFAVSTVATGRILTTSSGFSVYSSDGDARSRSNCSGECLSQWAPVLAGEFAASRGNWQVIERSPGLRQWAFRHKPLYTRVLDRRVRSLVGGDILGWHNVYVQRNPAPPSAFSVQDAHLGQVLADERGNALYLYTCDDDALDQLACDHPSTTQVYRLAICGKGDPSLCAKTWPFVPAARDASSKSLIWSAAWVDAQTGRFVAAGAPGALHVWMFRDRPLYTFARDERPGQTTGDAWGEAVGYRNGFKAFWLRDDFLANAE